MTSFVHVRLSNTLETRQQFRKPHSVLDSSRAGDILPPTSRSPTLAHCDGYALNYTTSSLTVRQSVGAHIARSLP
jgi:hypothetical protein